eukprot:GHVT01100989.1.p1 GENE.GHVT01100989.1~~GHVT01100989.1.p1  ORF type:complete len:171 (+),score=26.01 GHVT01100989.1:176-688(+)
MLVMCHTSWTAFRFFVFGAGALRTQLLDGLMTAAAVCSSSFQAANAMANFIIAVFSIINGVNLSPVSMPLWLGWLCYTSPFFYVMEGVTIAIYWDNDIFADPAIALAKYGFSSASSFLASFGFAGTAYGTAAISPMQWVWAVDLTVMAALLLLVRLFISYYVAVKIKFQT